MLDVLLLLASSQLDDGSGGSRLDQTASRAFIRCLHWQLLDKVVACAQMGI